MTRVCTIILCSVIASSTIQVYAAHAQIVVNATNDVATAGDGFCTLREAITNANLDSDDTAGDCAAGVGASDIVSFSIVGTITLTTVIFVTDSLVIDGPGADVLAISGNSTARVFDVSSDVLFELKHLTIRDAFTSLQGAAVRAVAIPAALVVDGMTFESNTSSQGGAIYTGGATLVVSNSTFVGNVATGTSGNGGGGAIYSAGETTIVNTTFSGNHSVQNSGGGAISVTPPATSATLDNVTMVYNTAPFAAAGLKASGAVQVTYKNSIIAGNVSSDAADQSQADCHSTDDTLSSEGFNILGKGTGCDLGSDIEVNAVHTVVEALADNGGPVPTHAIAFESPALNAGDTMAGGTAFGGCESINGHPITLDARGEARAQGASNGGSGCDIGAYEAQTDPQGLEARITVFLEGPYVGGGLMSPSSSVPVLQPFSDAMFDGTHLDHGGLERVASTDDPNFVDWVLVTLVGTLGPVATQAGWLMIDGSIFSGEYDYPKFSNVPPAPYNVVVGHRNHLALQSSSNVNFTSGTGIWNFTTSMAQAFSDGGNPMKALGDGSFGMFACDANTDGLVTAPDFNLWNASTTAGETGYRRADCNLDGIVTAPDFNLWNANTTAGAASQVP